MNRLTFTIIAFTLCLALQANVQVAAAKPPYERLLKEEDAKQAEKLQAKIVELEAADDYSRAITSAEELLALRVKLQGADHHETVTTNHDLVALRKITALDAAKRRHWQSAMQSAKVAQHLEAQGLHALALPLQQKILALRREVLGEEHPDTADSYDNVGANLQSQAKFSEAQPLFQKALDIHRRVLGEEHPATITSYNNVAMNLNGIGKPAEARPLFQKVLESSRLVHGEDNSETALAYLHD